jgi:Fe-S-cluster containining protein
MKKETFYADGLRFSCIRCSCCCRYESGYVFLSREDVDTLAGVQDMGYEAFIKTWCRWVYFGGEIEYLSLKEKVNNDCIFWKDGCMVYQSRPLQCRTFPFWDSILVSAAAWENAKSECPGMGQGELHSMTHIENCCQARLDRPVITRKSTGSGL